MNFSAYILRQRTMIRERHAGETFLYTRRYSAEPIAVAAGDLCRGIDRAAVSEAVGTPDGAGVEAERGAERRGSAQGAFVRPRSAQEIFDDLSSMQGLNASAFCCRT